MPKYITWPSRASKGWLGLIHGVRIQLLYGPTQLHHPVPQQRRSHEKHLLPVRCRTIHPVFQTKAD